MKAALLVSAVLSLVPAMFGQTNVAGDPVSGVWGDPAGPGFELKFDGKHTVSGTIRIVHGEEKSSAAIKSGSYDPETRALKLTGDAKAPDGTLTPFLIEGKIEKETVTGTYQFGDAIKGEFTLTRVKHP